ncbi:hypothetical protein C8R45DRAFT_947568 [Mycena sanguinolenta]|nr:hypothetical protein C8R45DRAFT_947568 [Mycena sanguinolenta]
MAPYRCPSPCGLTFDTKQGLSRHQGGCIIYNADNESDNDGEEAPNTSTARFRNMQAQKRQKLTHDTQISAASSMVDGYSDPPLKPLPDDPMLVDDPQPPSPAPVSSPPPEVSSTGRPVRTKRPTWKLLQSLPAPPSAAPELIVTDPDSDATPPPAPLSFVWDSVKSAMNAFGLYREYPRVPTHDPDSTISLEDLSDIPRAPVPASTAAAAAPTLAMDGQK